MMNEIAHVVIILVITCISLLVSLVAVNRRFSSRMATFTVILLTYALVQTGIYAYG